MSLYLNLIKDKHIDIYNSIPLKGKIVLSILLYYRISELGGVSRMKGPELGPIQPQPNFKQINTQI